MYLVPIELDRSDWEPLGLCHPWPWESIREKGSTSTPIVLGQPGEPVAFEGHFPPLLKAFPTSSEEWTRAGRKSQGLVYLFMSCLFCPAFYLKVTCWVSVGSWDHNSPVYAVFKIIVYSFFNSPWRRRVYRPSSFKRTIIKQRFPCKWLVSKWDSFHHTALTPYCSHTVLLGGPFPPFLVSCHHFVLWGWENSSSYCNWCHYCLNFIDVL